MRKKLYLVGIDALPLWLIRELAKGGGLGGFKRLLDSGLIKDAESVLPPMTAAAWPSIYTGLTPSEHWAQDFFMLKRNYTPDIAFYDSERAKPFWERLAKAGLRCLVITPATVVGLSKSENVDMISGFPLPPRASCAELKSLMKKHRFAGEADIGRKLKGAAISIRAASERLAGSVRVRAKIAEEMIERHDYDFVHVCFTETDRMQHFALGERRWKGYLLPLYREINSFLEFLLARADAEGSALMLVSDHGMQRIRSKFLINTWLMREGYAALKRNIESLARGARKEDKARGERLYVIREYLLKTKLRRLYKAIPMWLRPHLIRLAERLLLTRRKDGYLRIYPFDFDMRRTKAFAFMSVDPVCALWINDGRFDSGNVSAAEKVKLKARLVAELKEARDANGRRLLQNVYDGERYYGGVHSLIAPDLFIEAEAGYTVDSVYHSENSLFMKPGEARGGDHTRYGILGIYPHNPRFSKKKLRITDVARDVLSYYGLKPGNP